MYLKHEPLLWLDLTLWKTPTTRPWARRNLLEDAGRRQIPSFKRHLAVIDHGKVTYVDAYGIRNAKGDHQSEPGACTHNEHLEVRSGTLSSNVRQVAEIASRSEDAASHFQANRTARASDLSESPPMVRRRLALKATKCGCRRWFPDHSRKSNWPTNAGLSHYVECRTMPHGCGRSCHHCIERDSVRHKSEFSCTGTPIAIPLVRANQLSAGRGQASITA